MEHGEHISEQSEQLLTGTLEKPVFGDDYTLETSEGIGRIKQQISHSNNLSGKDCTLPQQYSGNL